MIINKATRSKRVAMHRTTASLRHGWALKSAAWRVFRAFRGYPVREETFSNALRVELRALLASSVVTREVTVPITFVASTSNVPVPCGHGRADIFIETPIPDDSPPFCTVVEVKRDRAGTGFGQARMYRNFLGADEAYLVIFTASAPIVTSVK